MGIPRAPKMRTLLYSPWQTLGVGRAPAEGVSPTPERQLLCDSLAESEFRRYVLYAKNFKCNCFPCSRGHTLPPFSVGCGGARARARERESTHAHEWKYEIERERERSMYSARCHQGITSFFKFLEVIPFLPLLSTSLCLVVCVCMRVCVCVCMYVCVCVREREWDRRSEKCIHKKALLLLCVCFEM